MQGLSGGRHGLLKFFLRRQNFLAFGLHVFLEDTDEPFGFLIRTGVVNANAMPSNGIGMVSGDTEIVGRKGRFGRGVGSDAQHHRLVSIDERELLSDFE